MPYPIMSLELFFLIVRNLYKHIKKILSIKLLIIDCYKLYYVLILQSIIGDNIVRTWKFLNILN